jgi:hypothetical protein
MCECLLEAYEQSEIPEEQTCDFRVHAKYRLGLDPIDRQGCTPRVKAEAEVSVAWIAEDAN